jgi:type I restriction enzyme S subunit
MSDVIPEGWSNPKLDDIVTKFQNGYAFSAKGYVPDGIPIISMGSIQLNGIFKKKNTKLKYWDASAKENLSRYLVKSEDLIMAMTDVTPTMELIGRACIVKGGGEYFLNQRVGLISVDEGKASKPFLSYLSNFDQWRAYCIGSSGLGAQANLGTSQILDGSILLPPLPEQQKIAAILSSVDEVIEKTQAQINKLKDLKTGMMQELLSPREGQAANINNSQGESKNGLHHTEFKDSPLGRIPVGWSVTELGNVISSMDGGVSVNSENNPKSHGQFGILKTSCISTGQFDPNENKTVLVNEEHRLRTPVLQDRIIFSRMNTPALVGKSGYTYKDYRDLFLPDRLWLIDVKDRTNINVKWLSYVLSSGRTMDLISELATGTSNTMKNISKPKLLGIRIALPSFSEQVKISQLLSSIDDKLAVSYQKLNSTQSLKKALMQDLLTGKVRVNVD